MGSSSEFVKNKKLKYLVVISFLLILAITLNITFGSLTLSSATPAANIRVGAMSYLMRINDAVSQIVIVPAQSTELIELSITADNKVTSSFEIIYATCSDNICTNFIPSIDGVLVQYNIEGYSVNGDISANGTRSFTIRLTNPTNTPVTIRFTVNAVNVQNNLALMNLITSYEEEPECYSWMPCYVASDDYYNDENLLDAMSGLD